LNHPLPKKSAHCGTPKTKEQKIFVSVQTGALDLKEARK